MGLNIIVPVLLGSEVSGAEGQVGMWVAVLICLIAGWGLCLWRPMTARKLVLGSLLLSMTQMVPILQILCGAIALGIVGGSIEVPMAISVFCVSWLPHSWSRVSCCPSLQD